MKRSGYRFRRPARLRRRSLAGTTALFVRYANLEALELRAMLSGTPLESDSALFSTNDDIHATPVHALSVASMLASSLAQQSSPASSASSSDSDPPPISALAATSESDQENSDEPPISPLFEGIAVNTFLNSGEYRTRSKQLLVDRFSQSILNRVLVGTDLTSWTQFLLQGGSLTTMIQAFVSQADYTQRYLQR